MSKFICKSRGFGCRPHFSHKSPYAVLLCGDVDVPRRTRLRFELIKRDMLEMGTNKKEIPVSDPCWRLAVTEAQARFVFSRQVRPFHLRDVFSMPLECRRSAPGLPWREYGYRTRGDVLDDVSACNSIRWFWHQVKNNLELAPPDCCVLYRAHIEGDDATPKIRAVYGYPTTITMGEAQFALPLIAGYQTYSTPIAYGYDMLLGGAMKLRRELLGHRFYGCFDFSKFDKTVSSQLIDVAFAILFQNIDFFRYEGAGIPDAIRLVRAWDFIVDYFKNTPMRLSNGERWKKAAGVPSGSYFTQLIDSIVNFIIIAYCWLKVYGRLPAYIRVFGDDSVVADDEEVDQYAIAKHADSIGMIVNPQKSTCTNNVDKVEFLGFCIEGGFPHRTHKKWLSSLYHPEYDDECIADFQSRALGLFYANHGIDSEFSDMCRYVVGFSPFKIGITRDMRRFLLSIGVDPDNMSPRLPSDIELIYKLIR